MESKTHADKCFIEVGSVSIDFYLVHSSSFLLQMHILFLYFVHVLNR